MKYSEVGKYGYKRLRKEKYKKIAKITILTITIMGLFFSSLYFFPMIK